MRKTLSLALLASALTACGHVNTTVDDPRSGLLPVNVPVVERSDYAFDLATAGGGLSAEDTARLDGWFRGLGLGYGDTVYLDGAYAEAARPDIARVAGNYGLMVSPGAPVTAGRVPDGAVRVVVSRSRASVRGCPNWSAPSQPNYENHMHSNLGCAVNSNIVAMVANPSDLVHGRAGEPVSDAQTANKAIELYRNWPLTAIEDGQKKRPLKNSDMVTGEDK